MNEWTVGIECEWDVDIDSFNFVDIVLKNDKVNDFSFRNGHSLWSIFREMFFFDLLKSYS